MSAAAGPERVGYGAVRIYAEPPGDLAALTGPTVGLVRLPAHLDWAPARVYDLAVDADRRVLYERVIVEAASTAELCYWLNGPLLAVLWARLWLPGRVRRLWQDRLPELAVPARTAATQPAG